MGEAMGRLMFKIMSGLHSGLYRASRGRIAGRVGKLDVLLLTTTGRKTGKPRTVPLLYKADGGGYAVIASKGGAADDPAWCVNLRASPAAQVDLGGKRVSVTAREAKGDERERLWRELADGYKGYDAYKEKTSREIPVFVLEPSPAE
jgi:deazaflavin-dependent oxidoreductase (nitroreductase family)